MIVQTVWILLDEPRFISNRIKISKHWQMVNEKRCLLHKTWKEFVSFSTGNYS